MTIIRATCHQHYGDVELRPKDVRIRTCLDDDTSVIAYTCPECRKPTTSGVPDIFTVMWLMDAGVSKRDFWRLDAEAPPDSPPLTEAEIDTALPNLDDLLDELLRSTP